MYLFKNSRFAFVWTVTTIALIVLLVYNTLVYFQLGVRAEFLTEKGPLVKNRLWLTAFYFHVFSSCVVLLTGAILFFSSLLKYRRMHLVLGYIYINIVLWIAAPTGLILSPVAKGGWPGALGFAVTGLAWWYTTWAGYRAIRQRRVNDHIAWMVRSWCLSLSAVTFRVLHIAFFAVGFAPLTNYVMAIWFSLILNAWFAEVFIARNIPHSTKRQATKEIEVDSQLVSSF